MHFGEFFLGGPAIVTFFYTRCENAQRCSLTITKLARLQRAIAGAGLAERIRTAGITYDPGFDRPPELRAYGDARGARFGERHRLLRVPEGLGALQHFFDLGIGFAGPVVNRHRIELFLLDADARIAGSFT